MWYGSKRETTKYRKYKKIIAEELKSTTIPLYPKLTLKIIIGISTTTFDLDNVFKPFLDSLQLALTDFNDRSIYMIHAKKVKVKKGDEYIKFKIIEYKD